MGRRPWLLALTVGALSGAMCASSVAQTPPQRAQAAQDEEDPLDGFWPTRTMVRLFIDRMLDDGAGHYELDETQIELTRDALLNRIPAFLSEHRRQFQPILNRFIEAQLLDEAPDPDEVARWSQSALPALAEFTDMIRGVTDDMREFLTDEQINKLDAESAAFEAGIEMLNNKLGVWAQGGYDPESDWIPEPARQKRREREQREAAAAGASSAERAQLNADDLSTLEDLGYVSSSSPSAGAGAAASQPAIPKDEWVRYVEGFIELYQLDAEQKQKAHAYLIAQIKARDRYLQLRGKDIEKATKALKQAKTGEETEKAQASFERLNEPLERMFERLKEKLDTVPNRRQIARAEAHLTTKKATGSVTSKPAAKQP